MEQKPLQDMTLDELKVLWFDQVEILEQVKVNLEAIRKMILSKKVAG